MAFVVQIGKVPDENGENRSRNMDMEKHPAMKHSAILAGPWNLFRDVLILLEYPMPPMKAADYFHGAQEYVHFTANRVSLTCGGFAGAMLVNCVPSLKIT